MANAGYLGARIGAGELAHEDLFMPSGCHEDLRWQSAVRECPLGQLLEFGRPAAHDVGDHGLQRFAVSRIEGLSAE